VVDQGAIRGSRRSNPATYTGLLEPVRKAFAKANGVKPALFSSNSEGACPACNGAGVLFTELGVMATVESPCEECGGRRFQASVLELLLGGRSIADVLEMPVAEALPFFADGDARVPAAAAVLRRLDDVGLGYVRLGQPLTTLSGGERQRLKLAVQMAEDGDVYVLDEPTTGLHLADVEQLLALLDRLVDAGTSVVVIEHHQAVMAHADWIIDLGPGAGHDGGRVVFEGTPADLVAARSTLTGGAPGAVRRALSRHSVSGGQSIDDVICDVARSRTALAAISRWPSWRAKQRTERSRQSRTSSSCTPCAV
jgi:excinuclease UvrABC ATPase subunit